MCTHFCTWQALNMAKSVDKEAMEEARRAAIEHIEYVVELYEMQLDAGRYFHHEQPLWATSWQLPKVEELMKRTGVTRVRGDQGQFGSEIQSSQCKGDPIMKPTGFMTNSPMIARALNATCSGIGGWCSRSKGGWHRLCSGKHAKNAAIYPRGLCRAILKGIRDQLREDSILKDGCFGVQAPDEDAEVEKNLRRPAQGIRGNTVTI